MPCVDDIGIHKKIVVTATNRLFHLMNKPLHLVTETAEANTEEDLFLNCWDLINFAQQGACDDQIYKLWTMTINDIIEKSDGYL